VIEEALSIVSERRGSTRYVAPSGQLDIATVELLEPALLAGEQADIEMIVLDLSSLAFIDSTGLRNGARRERSMRRSRRSGCA
jgi:anti-anti-sigma factor